LPLPLSPWLYSFSVPLIMEFTLSALHAHWITPGVAYGGDLGGGDGASSSGTAIYEDPDLNTNESPVSQQLASWSRVRGWPG
jgi:hypothetical protein